MNGTLYGVGVGPGDPELITIQAVRIIERCEVVAVPKTGDGEGVALQIARGAVPNLADKQLIELFIPMTRDKALLNRNYDEAAGELAELLRQGKNIAFLTLGDSTIYSTYTYVHKRIVAMGLSAQFVAGVPSFCAVAARLNIPLTEGAQPLHVLPASYKGADSGLDMSGTKILMKTGKAFDTVKQQLKDRGMLKSAQMVQKCGMEGERVFHDIDAADDGASYFSVIVVKEEEVQL
ncbi:precorrin-2 C(20)-methyltransferase [Hydrogenoanaerobacterium sp.]|uniref:precorrin-2 C(20)-methyltransferase n=1 Tax=Hydrogenoanaerobacterium sp. TaxID=2953763 RepID=UPI0028966372|nr:precorrin-2 C(20)-methyltransferase [Hydrogenoanaerobacterium sp.]